MKNKILCFLVIGIFYLNACVDLDQYPLSEGSVDSWYSNDEELEMAVADLFSTSTWKAYSPGEFFKNTDDFTYRSVLQDIPAGTVNGQSSVVTTAWNAAYACIASANSLLANINAAKDNVTEENLKLYSANAKFARAAQYAKLIFLFSDVPFYTKVLDIDEAFALSRTSAEAILDSVYNDYDYAIQNLPETYSDDEYQFATKGAALAMKARIALYMGDYSVARDAAKECMDLGVYELFPDYYTLFVNGTKNSVETIFCIPYSVELGVTFPLSPNQYIPRTVGGYGSQTPSWDLWYSYLCTDGLPVDESPLFDPHYPFKNRDPRCSATIVEFGSNWLGIKYEIHPDTLEVMNYNTGELVANKQNLAVSRYATYNGLALKKFIDDDWLDLKADNDQIIMRYADVLLMYAEAKIELGEIDESVLNIINQVRARAYGVAYTETSSYPEITTTDQSGLRKILRIERRMEFGFENDLRYNDIIRWEIAGNVLNKPVYGLLKPEQSREMVVNQGLWFLPEAPEIDEDGSPDYTELYNSGLILQLSQRVFDTSRQYLWPIPSSEILINPNLTQNPGY